MLIQLTLLGLPWSLRRRALQRLLGFEIDPTARIGLSLVAPKHLRMGPGSVIGHLNTIRGMDLVDMAAGCGIGRLNWIYGTPTGTDLLEHTDRQSALILEEGAGMTARHLVDCSATVRLGRHTELIGYGTHILTHQLDLRTGRQSVSPVTIGKYCMIATRCNILAGSELADCSVLGAGSTLRGKQSEAFRLYSGVPAKAVGAPLSPDLAWFTDAAHVANDRVLRAQGLEPPVDVAGRRVAEALDGS